MQKHSATDTLKQLQPIAKQRKTAMRTGIIAIDKLPIEYDDLKPWIEAGCIAQLEAGPSGKPLKTPVRIRLKPGLARRNIDVVNYVAFSLLGNYSMLTSWTVESPELMKLATYLRRHRTSSTSTLRQYIYDIYRFCSWIGKSPTQIIVECKNPDGTVNAKGAKWLKDTLDEYVGELLAREIAPKTISHAIFALKALCRVNDIELPKILKPILHVVHPDRAPKPEELIRMLTVADIRGKVVVSCLALGGFREMTLAKLRYRHVRDDLERGIIPIHVHVEATSTKGKYGDYDTFVAGEAAEYIRAYLDYRRRGSPCGKIPPETITDESPLIRNERSIEPKPVTRATIYYVVHSLYAKAGIIEMNSSKHYPLRGHSLRKYFRTQLAALGVPSEYIEYMMGHKISTYHDIKMKGVEFLRNVYATSGLSIKPKTKVSRIDMLKEIVRAWGMDPEKILVKEALTEPHRIVASPIDREENHMHALTQALKEMLRRELLNGKEG